MGSYPCGSEIPQPALQEWNEWNQEHRWGKSLPYYLQGPCCVPIWPLLQMRLSYPKVWALWCWNGLHSYAYIEKHSWCKLDNTCVLMCPNGTSKVKTKIWSKRLQNWDHSFVSMVWTTPLFPSTPNSCQWWERRKWRERVLVWLFSVH